MFMCLILILYYIVISAISIVISATKTNIVERNMFPFLN